jgi:hypothetical protein
MKLLLYCAGLLLCGSLLAATMSDDPNDVWKNVKKSTAADIWPALPPELNLSAYRVLNGKNKGAATASSPVESDEDLQGIFEKSGPLCIKATSFWLQYQFKNDAKQKVTAYVVTAASDEPMRDPKNWKLLGSTDGQTWETLDEQANQNFAERDMARLFKLAKPGSYSSYRLEVTANHGADCTQLADLKLLGDKEPGTSDEKKPGRKKGKKK